MGERLLILGLVVVAIGAAGVAIGARHLQLHHGSTVGAAQRTELIAAIKAQNPGAAVVRVSCGNVEGGPGCMVVLRHGGSSACNDWVANIGSGGQILAPVGTGDGC